jgi:hypothetical protein
MGCQLFCVYAHNDNCLKNGFLSLVSCKVSNTVIYYLICFRTIQGYCNFIYSAFPIARGNKNIKLHGFTTEQSEPLTKQVSFRVIESTAKQLDELGAEKSEFCRQAIEKALNESNNSITR